MMLRETLLAGLALVSLVSAGTAEAGIIYGPILNGYTTFTDTDTGLNWVRMDSFFNASYDDMASAVEAAGFTVAARSEVATLLDSLPIYDTSDWDLLANIMGRTSNRDLIWGSYGPTDADGNIGWAFAFRTYTFWQFEDGVFPAAIVPNDGTPDADMNIWAYYTGDVQPGVPEPAAWALMIGGFGLVGASLRRRRAALA